MADASSSEPVKAEPLTSREEQTLAGIADDLRASDPGLAASMERSGWTHIRLPPASLKPGVVLTVAALSIVPATALMSASGWATVGLLLTLFVLPCLILRVISKGRLK
jgi:hypothetical protein